MSCKSTGTGFACTIDESMMPGVIHAGEVGWYEEDWWTYSEIRADAGSVGMCSECGDEDVELVYGICWGCHSYGETDFWIGNLRGFREGLAYQ